MDDEAVPSLSRDILDRFVEGDRIAVDEVARAVLPKLYGWAFRVYPNLPQPEIASVIHDVVLGLCRHPERYDPDRSQITTYLIHILKLRLKDLYAKHQSIDTAEQPLENHEKSAYQPYNMIGVVEATTYLTRDALFQAIIEQLDPLEREVFNLMRQGVKDLAEYATIHARYGIVDNIAREVENTKARIRGRGKRTADRLGYRLEDLLDI